MIAYHDLCEIDYGDHTPSEKIPKEEKHANELICITRLANEYQMPEILELWQEYNENSTPEAKFVKMIDKVDAIMQSKVYAKKLNIPEVFENIKNNQIEIYNEFNQKYNFDK